MTTYTNHTLGAAWTANKYTVSFNGNGSTGGSTPSTTNTYDAAQALPANGFIRAGFAFAGWATSAAGPAVYADGQVVVNLASTQGAVVVLYAAWTAFDTVAAPVFNPDGGPFPGSSVQVTVTCATPVATIYFTTNGIDPTTSSPTVVSGAQVTVPVPGTLKARAYKDGMNTSAVKRADYTAANTVANSYKNVIRAFRAALLVYDRGDLLKREDKKGNWAKRVIEYKKKLAEGDKDYDRDEQYDPLIAFLFPEVWAVLSGDK